MIGRRYCIFQALLLGYRCLLCNASKFSLFFILQSMLNLFCIPLKGKIFPKSITLTVVSLLNFDSIFSCFSLQSIITMPCHSLDLEWYSHNAKLNHAWRYRGHLHCGLDVKQQAILVQCKAARLSLDALRPCCFAFVLVSWWLSYCFHLLISLLKKSFRINFWVIFFLIWSQS